MVIAFLTRDEALLDDVYLSFGGFKIVPIGSTGRQQQLNVVKSCAWTGIQVNYQTSEAA
jgi:hypothetical protein